MSKKNTKTTSEKLWKYISADIDYSENNDDRNSKFSHSNYFCNIMVFKIIKVVTTIIGTIYTFILCLT